jgi:hypothetical protein
MGIFFYPQWKYGVLPTYGDMSLLLGFLTIPASQPASRR